jgi:flagellum-specific peptidoglycan hydrolase FlgJ
MDLERQKRLNDVAAIAVALEAQTGCPPTLLVTQWAMESQWGAKPAGTNNFFGIKRAARHTLYCIVTTREWFTQVQIDDWNRKHPAEPARPTGQVNGSRKEVALDDEFADYASLADSCKDYAWMITNVQPYRAAWERYQGNHNLDALIAAVAGAYATSLSYTQLASAISRQTNVGMAIAQARKGVTTNATEA